MPRPTRVFKFLSALHTVCFVMWSDRIDVAMVSYHQLPSHFRLGQNNVRSKTWFKTVKEFDLK